MRHSTVAIALLLGACGPTIGPSAPAPVVAAPAPPQACASEPTLPAIPAGPLFVSYVQPDGAWVAVCQAPPRDGELLLRFGHHGESPVDARPRIVGADGWTLELDRFVAVGPRGRWVLAVREGALALVDTETRSITALRPSDPRDDASSYTVAMDHPQASFDRLGRRLVYLRWASDPQATVAVVRELATGDERVVPPPNHHRMLGARVDRDGGWVWIWSVPAALASRAFRRLGGPHRQCNGPAGPDTHDDGLPSRAPSGVERRVIAIVDGAPWVEGAVLGLGEAMLVREPDRSLTIVDADGERAPVVPAACDAIGLHAGAGTGSFAVLCRASDEVQVYEGAPPRPSVTYTFETPPRLDDDEEWRRGRWVSSGDRLFDLEGRGRATLPAGAEVLAEHAGRVLYRTGDCALGVAGGDVSTDLGARACGWVRSRAGAFVLFDDGPVIDLLAERVGVLSGRAWAVDDSGVALVTTAERPLFWERVHLRDRACPCEAGARPEPRD